MATGGRPPYHTIPSRAINQCDDLENQNLNLRDDWKIKYFILRGGGGGEVGDGVLMASAAVMIVDVCK